MNCEVHNNVARHPSAKKFIDSIPGLAPGIWRFDGRIHAAVSNPDVLNDVQRTAFDAINHAKEFRLQLIPRISREAGHLYIATLADVHRIGFDYAIDDFRVRAGMACLTTEYESVPAMVTFSGRTSPLLRIEPTVYRGS